MAVLIPDERWFLFQDENFFLWKLGKQQVIRDQKCDLEMIRSHFTLPGLVLPPKSKRNDVNVVEIATCTDACRLSCRGRWPRLSMPLGFDSDLKKNNALRYVCSIGLIVRPPAITIYPNLDTIYLFITGWPNLIRRKNIWYNFPNKLDHLVILNLKYIYSWVV